MKVQSSQCDYVAIAHGNDTCFLKGMQRNLLTLVLATAGLAFARHPKISADLDGLLPDKTVDVIIQYKHAPSEAHHQKVRGKGGLHKRSLDLINGSLYSVPAGAIEELAADADVAFISPDRPVRAFLNYASVAVGSNLANAAGWTGKGVGVAVLDSGIYATLKPLESWADINGRLVYTQDFSTDGFVQDYYGHGSHVAGIVGGAGRSLDNYQHIGIAPGVNLIVLKVLNQFGAGSDSGVIAAINKAIALKSQYNIRVLNLSLGQPVYESYQVDPLCQAVEAAWKAGIVVVVAAGNAATTPWAPTATRPSPRRAMTPMSSQWAP